MPRQRYNVVGKRNNSKQSVAFHKRKYHRLCAGLPKLFQRVAETRYENVLLRSPALAPDVPSANYGKTR